MFSHLLLAIFGIASCQLALMLHPAVIDRIASWQLALLFLAGSADVQ
jgi:hypothetical protein